MKILPSKGGFNFFGPKMALASAQGHWRGQKSLSPLWKARFSLSPPSIGPRYGFPLLKIIISRNIYRMGTLIVKTPDAPWFSNATWGDVKPINSYYLLILKIGEYVEYLEAYRLIRYHSHPPSLAIRRWYSYLKHFTNDQQHNNSYYHRTYDYYLNHVEAYSVQIPLLKLNFREFFCRLPIQGKEKYEMYSRTPILLRWFYQISLEKARWRPFCGSGSRTFGHVGYGGSEKDVQENLYNFC